MNLELSREELKAVWTALAFAATVPGFKYEYNPKPWVKDFESACQKVENLMKRGDLE